MARVLRPSHLCLAKSGTGTCKETLRLEPILSNLFICKRFIRQHPCLLMNDWRDLRASHRSCRGNARCFEAPDGPTDWKSASVQSSEEPWNPVTEPPDRGATESLILHTQGHRDAGAELTPLLYKTLRRIAGKLMRQERLDHTLQPTALVHEAYLRLIDIEQVDWRSKAHFCAMAAKEMRRVLVEHARGRNARKRGGGLERVTLGDDVAVTPDQSLDLLTLHEALEKLARRRERQSKVATFRIFAGMSVAESAYALDTSERTVANDWRFARAWLARELRSAH